jgi:hypothetical protein
MNTIFIIYSLMVIKRILQITIVFLLLFLVYFFYQPYVLIADFVFQNPFYAQTSAMPVWLYLIVYFIIISIINVFIFVSLSAYFNSQREKTKKIRIYYEKLFAENIVDYLLSEKHDSKTHFDAFLSVLKPLLRNKIQLESFFSAYTKTQETLALNLSEKFIVLLTELDLIKQIKLFLYSNKLDDRILAMKMYSYLRIGDYEKRISKYARSNNYALRTEAFAALVRLMNEDHHLVTFIGEKYNLSMLDINVIVNAVLKNFKMNINYQALLSSPLSRKVIVGLMLAKHRYKKEYRNLILILNQIGSKDNLLNKLAWDSFLSLVPENEAVDIIIDRFKTEPIDVKLMILKQSHKLQDQRFFEFLGEVIKNEELPLKVEAMKILFKNNFEMLAKYSNNQESKIKLAFQEVSDININS